MSNSNLLNVFSKDLKESLQRASEYIDRLEERVNSLEEENALLKKEAKKCADKALTEENTFLTERLKRSYGEFSSEKELKAYLAFCKKHAKCRNRKITAGKQPYVIPTYCGIGTTIEVVCPVCNEKQDITDTKAW